MKSSIVVVSIPSDVLMFDDSASASIDDSQPYQDVQQALFWGLPSCNIIPLSLFFSLVSHSFIIPGVLAISLLRLCIDDMGLEMSHELFDILHIR